MTDKNSLVELAERLRAYRGGDTEWRSLMDKAADLIDQLQRREAAYREGLQEAMLQLEYLDGKFTPTGTTACVLTRIRTLLSDTGG